MQAYPWRESVGTINGCSRGLSIQMARFSGRELTTLSYDPNADLLTAATPTTVHEDTWLVRIDHKINEKTLLYGRAQRDISLVDAPNGSSLPADKLQTINHPANYLLALEHTFTPNLFNEAKFYVNRSPFHNPQASALPFAVSTSNFVGLNDNTADIEVGTTYGVVDNLIWTHGRHAFKTGMEIRRVRLNQGQTANNALSFAIEADMTTATLSNISFIAPWCCHRLRRMFYMPYFQDEWKATPTFTLPRDFAGNITALPMKLQTAPLCLISTNSMAFVLDRGRLIPFRSAESRSDQYSAMSDKSGVVQPELQKF